MLYLVILSSKAHKATSLNVSKLQDYVNTVLEHIQRNGGKIVDVRINVHMQLLNNYLDGLAFATAIIMYEAEKPIETPIQRGNLVLI